MNYVDIHSHILPFMDDGAQDMSMAYAMLKVAEAEGITDIIVTPHYKAERFKGDRHVMQQTMENVQQLLDEEKIPIRLYPGNEIYYRDGLEEYLENGQLSTMNGTEYVLVEFSPMESFAYIRNAVDDILGMGYRPILAHVERYECMTKKLENIAYLKNIGCDIQINAASITGEIGFRTKRFCQHILKEGLADYIGTDAHNMGKRKPCMKKCADILYRKYQKEYVEALLFGNARKYLLQIDKGE